MQVRQLSPHPVEEAAPADLERPSFGRGAVSLPEPAWQYDTEAEPGQEWTTRGAPSPE